MRLSRYMLPTLKENPQEAQVVSHTLMLRAGMIRKLASGIYSYLPLGLKTIRIVEKIIREELNAVGGQEVLLPALHPRSLWDKTGRWDNYGKEMMRLLDRHNREFGLGPTHEEVITDLVNSNVSSYKQFPILLYQFQTKFRDEIRPRFGVMRAREFIMKDAYSFDTNEEDAHKSYEMLRTAYSKIFKKFGLDFRVVEADSGLIGGSLSHEYMVIASSGEEGIQSCPECDYASKTKTSDAHTKKEADICPDCGLTLQVSRGIEVGHTFKLGTKYSKAMHAVFLDENGKENLMVMGCYGIGVGRLVAAAIEQNHDANGIIWPIPIAPYKAIIVPLKVKQKQEFIDNEAEQLYNSFIREGIEVLLDDRDEPAGVKFKDADLIGIPIRITLGKTTVKENKVEIKKRINASVDKVEMKKVLDIVKSMI